MLKDKVIVVTGGSKGIGLAISEAAAKNGAKVVIGGRNTKEGEQIVSRIRNNGGEALFYTGDLTDLAHCEGIIRRAIDSYGRLDGLVNYAGTVQSQSPLTDTSEEDFDFIFKTNFKSTFFVTKYALREMKKNGGSVIFMGSMHAYGGEEDRAAYACTKGAMLTLFKHVNKNYTKFKIRSNWITIGWVATPGELSLRSKENHGQEWLDDVGKKFFPMGRLQTAEDNVDGALYLLSDGASQVSGTELFISGGFTF
jgi:NAD(P)-dependent dehydrogenase (short-subunit alcohol dehydrogenase family)